MPRISYTTINHDARIPLDLSMNEYAVVDLIYHLSNNPKSTVQGWCYASKATIGKSLGLSEKSVHTILAKVIARNLVEKHPETKHLKASSLWYQTVVIKLTEETSVPLKKGTEETSATLKKVQSNTEESSAPIYDKDNNKEKRSAPSSSPKYLTNIPLEDIQGLRNISSATEAQIRRKGEELSDWLLSKGRTYKDYRAFLRNAVRRDFPLSEYTPGFEMSEGLGYIKR